MDKNQSTCRLAKKLAGSGLTIASGKSGFNIFLIGYLPDAGLSDYPVFARIPFVSCLESFGLSSRCAWIHLSSSSPHSEIKFTVDKFEGIIDDEIVETVRDRTIPMEWERVVKIMKNNKYEVDNLNSYSGFGRGLYGERYKPVYFIMVD